MSFEVLKRKSTGTNAAGMTTDMDVRVCVCLGVNAVLFALTSYSFD